MVKNIIHIFLKKGLESFSQKRGVSWVFDDNIGNQLDGWVVGSFQRGKVKLFVRFSEWEPLWSV